MKRLFRPAWLPTYSMRACNAIASVFDKQAKSGAENFWALPTKKKFNDNIWSDFKETFGAQSQGLCAYCEGDPRLTGYGTMEHYRPKATITMVVGDKLVEKRAEGYWWQAYDWNNWGYGCALCNTTKGSVFPLEDDSVLPRSLRDVFDVSIERPLLIDPYTEDPAGHIELAPAPDEIRYDGTLNALSPRGECTIHSYGLQRLPLCAARGRAAQSLVERLEELTLALDGLADWPRVRDALQAIVTALDPKTPFSGILRNHFEKKLSPRFGVTIVVMNEKLGELNELLVGV